jgi:phosphoribosylaminoimidazole-succinocarboxamide synthase
LFRQDLLFPDPLTCLLIAKFEFALDEASDDVVLVDEVLSPDSSRFWNASSYEAGREQQSLDKQYLRDWLTSNNLAGKEGVEMPANVVAQTKDKYSEVFTVCNGYVEISLCGISVPCELDLPSS